MAEQYRFENGKLFRYDSEQNAYVFVYSSIYATTKAEAIRAYRAASVKC